MPRKPKVSIVNFGKSLERARKLIELFKKRNNMNFHIEIKLDFDEPDLGRYEYKDTDKAIYINPSNCSSLESPKGGLLGHPNDYSICSVIMHEFSHFIDHRLGLEAEYVKQPFTKETMAVTEYALTSKQEELADLMAVYMINPYFVHLVAPERFEWLKGKFKSPAPFGQKTFIRNYNRWSMGVKLIAFDVYGLKVNKKGKIYKEEPKYKFAKTDDGKMIIVRKKSPKKRIKIKAKTYVVYRRLLNGFKKDN